MLEKSGKMASQEIIIGDKLVSDRYPAFLIAEIGSNHNQDKSLALEMIEMAAEAGADAVKFQSIKFKNLYQLNHEKQSFKDWFKAIELDENWYPELANRARECGLAFMSSPTYKEAIPLLEECGVPAYKIASPQAQSDHALVREVAKTGKPIIASTGYCHYGDITKLLELFDAEKNDQLILLHCISKYPMDAVEANLRYMQTLKSMTGCLTGFSDHSLDDHIALSAVALGACVIEKHVTLDRGLSGPDHHFAMTFDEFGNLSKRMTDVFLALGDGTRLKLLKEENELKTQVQLKAFSKRAMPAGAKLCAETVVWSRYTGDAVLSEHADLLDKAILKSDIGAGEPIAWNLLEFQA